MWQYEKIKAHATDYDISFSRALIDLMALDRVIPSTPAKPKGKKLPFEIWEGDPWMDPHHPTYAAPNARLALYNIDKKTPAQIRDAEELIKLRWPRAETVYEAGLLDE